VYAVGAGDRLVGVSSHSDFPEEARRLPVVGGLTPDLERIVSLRPDLVLATTEGNSPGTVRLLEDRGIPVLTTSAPDLRGVLASIEKISRRLGAEARGRALIASLSARWEAVSSRVRNQRRVPSILLVWPSPPQAAGTGTFGDDLLRQAGGANCVDRPGWPAVSPEFLVTSDCVVVYPRERSSREVFEQAFTTGPLSRMPAVRRGQRVAIDGDLLTRPGPRAFDALEKIEEAFRSLAN
jgi:iron complex transport system substrate-binding protein